MKLWDFLANNNNTKDQNVRVTKFHILEEQGKGPQ